MAQNIITLFLLFLDLDLLERFISIGLSRRNRVLLAVHTEREEQNETIIIRIISCRKATQTERRRYDEKEAE
jgi:uncharacterized DUF497 family protein